MMANTKQILQSFGMQETLNQNFWVESEKEIKLRPEIKKRLLEIAYEFIEFISVDVFVEDIIMTGSLANFNWSKFSDVDLHLVINYEQFPKEIVPLYEELFNLKKMMFNEKHDIKIKGYDVELYPQSSEQTTKESAASYSILFDKWLTKPERKTFKLNKKSIEFKLKNWMNDIDNVIKNVSDDDLESAKKIIKKYKDKIKAYRKTGLDKGGEFSIENLVFKALRRNGYIQKLYDFENELIDKKLSLKERNSNFLKN